MRETYIDTCRQATASIDAEALAARIPAECIDSRSGFEYRSLGAMMLSGISEDSYIGLKVPQYTSEEVALRASQEIGLIDLYVDHVPELRRFVPQFTCLLKIEDSPATAIVTEDITADGQLPIRPVPVSSKVKRSLYRPFLVEGSMDEVMEYSVLEEGLAFQCGIQERLLNFTPSPVRGSIIWIPGADNTFADYFRAVDEALPDLTITIPQTTPLGEYLQNKCAKPEL